jgi:hypothetical protein
VRVEQFDLVNFYFKLSHVLPCAHINGAHFAGENNNKEEMPMTNRQWTCYRRLTTNTHNKIAGPI